MRLKLLVSESVRSLGANLSTTIAATMIRPDVGSSSLRSRRMTVDLPEPDAPTTNTNSPLSITKDTSESARTFGS